MTEKRLRWGLLSTARINERLIPAIRKLERSELLAVASRDKKKAEQYAGEWTIPRAYDSYEALLADPDIDVVYIPLPNSYHAEWSIKSAEAGKHILCEKPLALTPEEVDRMADAAERNGVLLQEAAMYRFHPQTLQVRDLIAQGVIGELRLIRAIFSVVLGKTRDIRFEPDLGGGSLWDLGSYPVSFSRAMVRAEPDEVFGWQVSDESGVDLTFMGQMRFPGDTLAQFSCSFRAVPNFEAELIGTRGLIHLSLPWLNRLGETAQVRILRAESGARETFGDSRDHLREEILSYEKVDAYQHEVDAMVGSILDGSDPIISLSESRGNVATLVALYTSARENRPVSP